VKERAARQSNIPNTMEKRLTELVKKFWDKLTSCAGRYILKKV
jgi:hypothetical protein